MGREVSIQPELKAFCNVGLGGLKKLERKECGSSVFANWPYLPKGKVNSYFHCKR